MEGKGVGLTLMEQTVLSAQPISFRSYHLSVLQPTSSCLMFASLGQRTFYKYRRPLSPYLAGQTSWQNRTLEAALSQ